MKCTAFFLLLRLGSLAPAAVAQDTEASAEPGAIAGRFTMEVYPWYGPVGITYTGAPTP